MRRLMAAAVRHGQARFRFRVLARYGACCAVCNVSAAELLGAAHLRPKEARGTDDPRNGLVLCATHHRALDAGLFGIEPEGYGIRVRPGGPSAAALGLTRPSLQHLARRPHEEAVRWRWRHSAGEASQKLKIKQKL